jgi:hypothetical protein
MLFSSPVSFPEPEPTEDEVDLTQEADLYEEMQFVSNLFEDQQAANTVD